MINNASIQGNLGSTPVLRETGSGRPVLNFSIANDTIKYSGDRRQVTTRWFDITLWDSLAVQNSKRLTKGSNVTIVGKLNDRRWVDREGNPRRAVEIVGTEVHWHKIAEVEELTTKPEDVSF